MVWGFIDMDDLNLDMQDQLSGKEECENVQARKGNPSIIICTQKV